MQTFVEINLNKILYGGICIDFENLLSVVLSIILALMMLIATANQVITTIKILRQYYVENKKEKDE
ncbi:hypothetical protein [Vibrio sp. VB16]|uniref:hypothetical protein n=1 Tax=Vibrio sp. VB16 TaxID=2785746 RepID=UPI00189F3C55|nr:hypothetical protein [Vibrio sp. VB16]UGA53646.1 hypothetical protein IUZ65_010100 [Vibrio sp. VB16]